MRIPRTIIVVFFIAALVGFADSTYLTAQHLRGAIPPCGLTNECDTVLNSEYASIGPLPVAALGLLYYGTVIVLLVAYLDSYQRRIIHWASWLVSAGLLGSAYFVFVQGFVLHAWCMYCLTSALMTFIMFLCAVRIMRID